MFNKIKNYLLYIIIFVLVFFPGLISSGLLLAARAGGAGGSSSGSDSSNGGGDGLFILLYYIFMLIPFPWNIAVAAIVIVLFLYFSKKNKEKSVYNDLPTGDPTKKPKGYDEFLTNNPEFKKDEFISKVSTAFLQIQQAWQDKNLSTVRKYISDGVYQRFNTQFKMMDILKQTDVMKDIKIDQIYIDEVEADGLYDILHVAVYASLNDEFKSELYPELNSGGFESFVEYWSFIKKRGVAEKDLYSTNNCPKCGAGLPQNAGDVSKCEYCNTLTNLGEYDWILSEITQADDYVSSSPKVAKTENLNDKLKDILAENSDFSVQFTEDKASNGYLQIMTSFVYKDPIYMRRFVTDEALEKIKSRFTVENFVFNRLFLNYVTLIGVRQDETKNYLIFAIKSSYQRVNIIDKKAQVFDLALTSKQEFMVMVRDRGFQSSKGSLYAHSCPSCGGAIADTLDTKCSYCGSELNSPKNEWIVHDILNYYEYNDYLNQHKKDFSYQIDPNVLDGLFKVRDYAFNNMLIIFAADGVFEQKEKDLAEEVAKKWGYNIKQIQPIFDMAKSGNLAIRMPEDIKDRKKIYKLMEKAALADENMSEEEQKLLDSIKEQYVKEESA